jgi:2-polyprenyl-6-methoxyphenol hydroxylase-like FAD-dependent oxidoreductase
VTPLFTGGEEFNKATADAVEICDQLAAVATRETRKEMLNAYLQVRNPEREEVQVSYMRTERLGQNANRCWMPSSR